MRYVVLILKDETDEGGIFGPFKTKKTAIRFMKRAVSSKVARKKFVRAVPVTSPKGVRIILKTSSEVEEELLKP